MRYLLLLLALGGAAVSILALRVHYSTDVQPCSINEKWDCGVVNHSRYAEINHVPVAAIGLLGYLMLGWLAVDKRKGLVCLSALVGLQFALYLTHIERDVLEMWCLYCVISQGIIAVMSVLSVCWVVFEKSPRAAGSRYD